MISILLALIIPTLPVQTGSDIGPWRYIESVDPITDERTASFVIGDAANNLAIGCRTGAPDTLTAYWRGNSAFQNNIDMALRGALTYRFDADEPITVATVLWSAKKQMHFFQGAEELALLRRLPTSTRLVLRDSNSTSRTVVFSYTAGQVTELVRRIDASCGTTLSAAE